VAGAVMMGRRASGLAGGMGSGPPEGGLAIMGAVDGESAGCQQP